MSREKGSADIPVSYVVWFDNINYHADSMTGGADITPNPDFASVVNPTLVSGNKIVIKTPATVSTPLLLTGLSNVIVQLLGKSSILTTQAGTRMNIFNVTNSIDCQILDGLLDGNKTNQTDGAVYTNQCGIFGNPVTRLTLKNLTVQNNRYSGIFLRNDTGSILDQLYCQSNGVSGDTGGVAAGVLIDGVDNTHYSKNTRVSNSQSDNNRSWGFSVGDFTEYVKFLECDATGNSTNFDLEPGVFANNAWVSAIGCSATAGITRNFYITGSRCRLIGCESQGSAVAIRVEGSTHILSGNTIISPSQEGIQCSTVTRSSIVGNMIYGSGRAGLWMGANQFVVATGNILYQCGDASTYPCILLTSTSTKNNMISNIIDGNGVGLWAIQESTFNDDFNEIHYNIISNTIGTISKAGTHTSTSDNPGFNARSINQNGATIQVTTKAGTPSDSDFTNPLDGLVVVDTTGNKIWTRIGGVWKGATVA